MPKNIALSHSRKSSIINQLLHYVCVINDYLKKCGFSIRYIPAANMSKNRKAEKDFAYCAPSTAYWT